MEDADPLPGDPEHSFDSALGSSCPSLAKGDSETFNHGISDSYLRNSENCEQDDGDDDHDDVGLYLALNTIPVKVELEETGGDIIVDNEEEANNGDLSVETAVDASQILEGIASTSGSVFSNLSSIPREGHLWIDFDNGIQEQPIKRKRKCRNVKGVWRSKMKGKTEEQLQIIRQRNRLQKQNKRRLMQERIFIESMCGIADESYDLYDIEERKQRGELLTATEQLLLLKKRDRDRQKRRRESMTEQERFQERKRNRERKQQQRERQKIAILENLPDEIASAIPVPKKSKVQELTEEQAEKRRTREREYKRNRRKNMTEEQLSVERQKNRERKRISNGLKRWKKGTAGTSGNEVCEKKAKPKEEQTGPVKPKRRKRRRRRTYFCEEDKLQRRKILARERAKKYRSSLTKEQLQTLRERDRERTKLRRLQMTEEECQLIRLKNKEQAQVRRLYKKQTRYRSAGNIQSEAEKALLIREKNRERMRLKRSNMTEEEKIIERQKNRERVRKRREIQRAESLLQRLINVHSDMIKQNPESEHFLQTLMEKEGEDIDQKLLNMNCDKVKELVHSADNNIGNEHVEQHKF